jgi:single-stranded-DNA-specific exonuclease
MNSKKPVQTLTVDMELECSDITEDLIKDISRLEPYGASNPLPLFVVKDFKLVKKSLMGSTHDHLRLTVEKDGETFVAIWWHYGDIYLKPNDTLDIAFSPQLNTFNGRTSIQLIIRDIHSDCFVEPEETKVITYDNRRKTDIIDKVNDYLKTSKFDFVVFAEKNTIVNSLKAYPEIYKRIVNRYTLKQSDGLMFFDYPPTEEMMDDILNIVSPIRIHYMNYNIDSAKSFDYIKTMAGMIKYVCKSKDGQFDLNNSATFLGITTQMVEELLECFESCGSIKILDRGDDAFVISYINPASLEDIKSSEDYEVFSSSLTEVIDTREYFLNREIVTI